MFNKSESNYEQILEKDTVHIKALHNLGVLYYNQALHLLNQSKKTGLTEDEIDELQNKSQMYMKLYTPYATKYNRLTKKQKKE